MITPMSKCKEITLWHDGMVASRWRHQMVKFSALLAICAGNSPVPGEFPHKGQWRGALMFSLICARINGWVNNGEAGDFRRLRVHYDVIVMMMQSTMRFGWIFYIAPRPCPLQSASTLYPKRYTHNSHCVVFCCGWATVHFIPAHLSGVLHWCRSNLTIVPLPVRNTKAYV